MILRGAARVARVECQESCFGGIVKLQFGKKDRAFLAKLGESSAKGNAMRTGFVSREAPHEERFDFGGDGVFHAFGFGMRFGPR